MIKLSDLIDLQVQPSEPTRMSNFLYRGSREQNSEMQPNRFNVGDGGTVEEMDTLTTDHPENKEYQVGKSWEEPNLFEGGDIQDVLLGREFQTLEDLARMASRLRQAGYTQDEINEFVINAIK
jgi:hypothetical protein